ncbi:sugar phosphate nucleotidyltransferase [Pseudomonas protegens]|uniref:sugar phosphate nucleotidyltransferase n=1 Tax=Pseudomonas protegens TaxID=380021 RepID=UPI00382161A3
MTCLVGVACHFSFSLILALATVSGVRLLVEYKSCAYLDYAAESYGNQPIHELKDFIEANIVGVFRLLEAARAYLRSPGGGMYQPIKPSEYGEQEVTDLNCGYLKHGSPLVDIMGCGHFWQDTGAHKSLFEANFLIGTLEHRQGPKVANPESYLSAEMGQCRTV